MENFKKYIQLLKEKDELNKRIELVAKEAINEISPYKIGDVVEVKGYSHKGKKCRIAAVHFKTGYDKKLGIKITAKVLKKDGSDSQNIVDWTSWMMKNYEQLSPKLPHDTHN